VLKLLQWGEPVRPWRLKTPTHILFLEYLNRAFPDARFVMTHRDPTDVILSVADVYADIAGVFTDDLDRHYLGRLNVEHWSLGMDRALKFRDAGADDRFYDIDFRAMQKDPIGEIRGLYAWLGEPVTDDFEAGMRTWWAENAENREPSIHPDPATFGLDLDQVRPLFAEYVTRSKAWTTHSS
jgi:Sulfotransferase family